MKALASIAVYVVSNAGSTLFPLKFFPSIDSLFQLVQLFGVLRPFVTRGAYFALDIPC